MSGPVLATKDINDIKSGQCYRLVTAKIVRDKTLEEGIARCDIYRHMEQEWIGAGGHFTASLFHEACDDPSNSTES